MVVGRSGGISIQFNCKLLSDSEIMNRLAVANICVCLVNDKTLKHNVQKQLNILTWENW